MKYTLRIISIRLIRYLQRRYKRVTINNRRNQNNKVLAQLILIQAILYYFKSQFKAWGYFHPSCGWSNSDEKYFRWLFPTKDFKELDIVVWYNPEAVTYYRNKIYKLSKGKPCNYSKEIEAQLRQWDNWN